MRRSATIGQHTYTFADLREVMAKATPERSGDHLAAVSAHSEQERVAAQVCLADTGLRAFLDEALVPYEVDEVTRLILDTHDTRAFAPIAALTVGEFRDHLLAETTDADVLADLAPGITPEMAAAVSKIMRNQDLVAVASRCQVETAFRNTLGLPGRLSSRIQPNDPTDDPRGIAASIVDGLLYGCGDACIGINPATDSVRRTVELVTMLDDIIRTYSIPTQSCVLAHLSNTLLAIEAGAPVDLVFQSIAGTQAANQSFGISLGMLREAHDAARSLGRGPVGNNVMYFETGRGHACPLTPITALTSRPSKPAPTGSPGPSRHCWSTRLSVSSARSTSTTASRSGGPVWRTISAANCSACRWASMCVSPRTPKPTPTTPTTS